MAWLRTMFGELIGLFVDDGWFAVAILAWIAVAWIGTRLLGPPGPWTAAIFCLGFVAILVDSVRRRAATRVP